MTLLAGLERLALLHDVAQSLSRELDERRLFEGVALGVRRLLDTPVVLVARWDAGREELVPGALLGAEAPRPGLAPAEMPACCGRAFLERRTVVVEDLEAHPRAFRLPRGPVLHASVATPLLRDGASVGVLFAAHVDPARRIGAEDARLLELLASHVVLVLDGAATLAAATRRLARLDELSHAVTSLLEARTRDAVIDRALDCATTLLGGDRAAFFAFSDGAILEGAARRLSAAHLARIREEHEKNRSFVPAAAGPVVIRDAPNDPRLFSLRDLLLADGIRTVVRLSVERHRHASGVLVLYHEVDWAYDVEEKRTLRAFGEQLALALGNAALHEEMARKVATLRALDGHARAVAQAGDVESRARASVQALVAGGAAAAWVWVADRGQLVLAGEAGHAATPVGKARALAEAAMRSAESAPPSPACADRLIAAPLLDGEELLGALVLVPSRPSRPEPRPGTLIVRFGDDEPAIAERELVSTAAVQLSVALAHARLLSQAQAGQRGPAAARKAVG